MRTVEAIYQEISEEWVALADLYAELGAAIKAERQKSRLSQKGLGECLGLSRDQVASYESGRRWKQDQPGIERIVRYFER